MDKKQKSEAIKMLRTLGLMKEVRDAYDEEGIVYYSERQNKLFPAVLYFLHNQEKYVAAKERFEAETGAVVFHCILTHTEFGDLLDMLYVPKEEADWPSMEKGAKEGEFVSYCYNLTDGFGEAGYIGVHAAMGGLIRTW